MDSQLLAIHRKAQVAAKMILQGEEQIVLVLQEVDAARVYLHLGYKSLWDYVTLELKLSPASASNYITVARKAKEVPALQQLVVSGKLGVAKARKVCPVLTKENQKEWLELAVQSSQKEIEKLVAETKPILKVPERNQPVAKNLHHLSGSASDKAAFGESGSRGERRPGYSSFGSSCCKFAGSRQVSAPNSGPYLWQFGVY